MPYHAFPVLNHNFLVDKKYEFIRELGQGAYGVVCAAKNTETKESVAIKKVTKVFDKNILAKRALREVKLLKHFNGHENVELMEADLHQIIRSEQPLTDAHFQYFVYQICRGLKYIHSANVLHRDLKPGNLLVNADCELKICDFGLARGFSDSPDHDAGFMTEYVATRWYRAPEIMLSFQNYTKAIGCIFAEMLGGKPLFKGRDYVDQLNQILSILGTPDEETLRRVGSDRAQIYIRSLQRTPKIPFSQLYARANPLALDLLEKLLKFDPSIRITVEQALAHPYLAAYHDEEDEPSHEKLFDFSFETVNSLEEMRGMIVQEVVSFKKSKQAVLTVNGAQLGRKPSLSAHERDSIMQPRQRQQQQQQNNYDSYAASQHGIIKPENMEVDEQLENELGGYINYQQ
ncbi:17231_t:CDS:10 [Entrophospora sp. SA101]|nr:787_t:CDS:10 [Entrophospora sp. SA101]CAJ0760286.1 17231_t:CDS:10 [Entrophospora sp. SA101]CAJ0830300.1 14195_t:CDS:10 [Entrophospora sp. SA101]CAJ0911804.1 7693_t:CDS:10 [Entrophospora sp. SA101]CAJ0918363.1 17672_t:CDS:10 [Entrophospora sp. SA101]